MTSFARGEPGFEEAIKASSVSAHDPGRRPDIVCQARDVDEVVAAVRDAAARGLTISVRSGGHSWSQNHIRDGGILIDVSRLNEMNIDVGARTAVVGPGLLGGAFDTALTKLGLFFPVAHAKGVGLGGFLLQGGYGWYSRVVGMASEHVTAVDVVLADGTLVRADENEHSDLFWAARGAGPGFFGVVVRFHLNLLPRPRFTGTKIQVFRIRHLEEVMAWADDVQASIPPNVETQFIFKLKAAGIFAHGIELTACVLADSWREAREALRFIDDGPLRKKASLTSPLIPLSLRWMMRLADLTVFRPNRRWFADNVWLNRPIGPALPIIRRIAEAQPVAPSHALLQIWNPASRDRPDMAFSLEGGCYFAMYAALPVGGGTEADERWATEGALALQDHSFGSQLSDENLSRRPARIMAPENLRRLMAIRRRYDPAGRFHSYEHMAADGATSTIARG